jgi:hypothetical protein
MKADQEEMLTKIEARIEDNNEKIEVLQGTLIFWMDIHQEKMDDGLPRNDGGMSGVQGANLRGHGIRNGALGGSQGTCRSGNWWSAK